jgi:hypothetical protein
VAVPLLWGIAAACDPGFPAPGGGPTISEDAFVETVVELRRAAAHWEARRLPEGERDSILRARGVSQDDLFLFVEVHGPDVPYMSQVWTRIDALLTGREAELLREETPDPEALVEEGLLPREALPGSDVPDGGGS